MSSFKLTRKVQGGSEFIHLLGPITEEASLQFLNLHDIAKKTTFNFRQVESINSNGLRAWILFVRDNCDDHEIILEECPPVIVSQMNMLGSFAHKAKVKSVYVPFYCGACQHITTVLFEAKNFPQPGQAVATPSCAKCGAATALDEEEYFNFTATES